eukprot:TRINITY_DN14995_c0_g1_i1.p1 TRINITY_DN14995_c0_g1~~TRINITY_DN14995_c0_g1_i1.p1  ORF type:complete len:1007 (+),score=206.91 TRINITY_DN14995_c0_g1_i1:50-3022(+)
MANISGRVGVFVRVRPRLPSEGDSDNAVITEDELCRLTIKHKEQEAKVMNFDAVIGPSKSQEHIFSDIGQPILDSVLCGYNGTIFAYGQTGSGKTYTLLNLDGDTAVVGLIPRMVAALYGSIANDVQHVYTVKTSMLQIYNESIDDLLRPGNLNLSIRESKETGVYVEGLSWYTSPSAEFLLQCLNRGRDNLVYAETKMNKHSSRSHAVFQIFVTRRQRLHKSDAEATEGVTTAACTIGKLTLVDLAGSERVKKSGAAGQRFVEATRINSSLLTLGNVIQALAENRQLIPYRDSKLTRLLQERLGGDTKTSLLVCVSPLKSSTGETLRTLEFGSRAMKVKVDARINEGTIQVDAKTLASDLAEEMRLRAKMTHSGELISLKDNLLRQEEAHKAARDEFESQLQDYESRLHENEAQHEALLAEREQRERLLRLTLQRKGSELGHAAGKVKQLKEENEALQAQFAALQAELITAKEAHASAVTSIQLQHAEQTETLRTQQAAEVEKYQHEFQETLSAANDKHATDMQRTTEIIRAEFEEQRSKLETAWREERDDLLKQLAEERSSRLAAEHGLSEEKAGRGADRVQHQQELDLKQSELIEALRIQHERSQELIVLYKQQAEIEEKKQQLESQVETTVSELELTRQRRAEEQAKYDALLADKDRLLTDEELRHQHALEQVMQTLDEREASLAVKLEQFQNERDVLAAEVARITEQFEKEQARHAQSQQEYERQAATLSAAQKAEHTRYQTEILSLKQALEQSRSEGDFKQSSLQLALKQKEADISQLLEAQNAISFGVDLERRLAQGALFTKHGRSGRPHDRFVRIVNDRVEWTEVKDTSEGHIRLSDVTDVVEGIQTSVARRTGDVARADCFLSIVTPQRTLDLECTTRAVRDEWVRLLRQTIAVRRTAQSPSPSSTLPIMSPFPRQSVAYSSTSLASVPFASATSMSQLSLTPASLYRTPSVAQSYLTPQRPPSQLGLPSPAQPGVQSSPS